MHFHFIVNTVFLTAIAYNHFHRTKLLIQSRLKSAVAVNKFKGTTRKLRFSSSLLIKILVVPPSETDSIVRVTRLQVNKKKVENNYGSSIQFLILGVHKRRARIVKEVKAVRTFLRTREG